MGQRAGQCNRSTQQRGPMELSHGRQAQKLTKEMRTHTHMHNHTHTPTHMHTQAQCSYFTLKHVMTFPHISQTVPMQHIPPITILLGMHTHRLSDCHHLILYLSFFLFLSSSVEVTSQCEPDQREKTNPTTQRAAPTISSHTLTNTIGP